MQKKKVIVAMSGGVDSTVAAALLKEQGYEVLGITLKLFSRPSESGEEKTLSGPQSLSPEESAESAAAALGIAHRVIDLQDRFNEWIVSDFIREYSRGRTPNPCIRCNRHIKFSTLLDAAEMEGSELLATGHYAQVNYDPHSGRYLLKKGQDRRKDQSYFLYALTQTQLACAIFPVGALKKAQVREIACKMKLPVAIRPESQEVCFIPENDYIRFLKKRIPQTFQPGPIVDISGRRLGWHQGIIHFTVGQRRGMGISAPHPLYVLKILSKENTIVAGSHEGLYQKQLLVSQINWIACRPVKGAIKIRARIRYKHHEAPATLIPRDTKTALVKFDEPQRAITPGQSVVFYDGDTVLGGGIIEKIPEQDSS